MVFLVGLGLAGLFQGLATGFDWLLKVVSVVYMLWLAWKIAHAGRTRRGAEAARPMTFLQAAAFQWVNPKAWAMALGAVSAYVAVPSVAAYAGGGRGLCAGQPAVVSLWVAAGQGCGAG
jgi:threonine/homoserine/homoserine lactone efflux protein